MKFRMLISKVLGVAALVTIAASCKKLPKEIEVVERREVSQYDNPAVYKNGYEPWVGTQPMTWRKISSTKFRLLNYAVGEATQIAVGESGGGVLPNLNRWRGEFGQEPLQNTAGLETIEMLSGANVIYLKGTYQKKMGGRPVSAEGWAVTGVICELGGGNVLTVKMVGPEAEVEAEKENLINFAQSLRINKLQTPRARSQEDKKAEKTEGSGY